MRTWREVADVCREWLSAAANGVAANQDSDEAEETGTCYMAVGN